MFAILGEIEVEVASGLTGMELHETADWAEHARIKGKPLLEWVGDGLDQYTLTIELHPLLGDPGARQRQLREAKAAHEPLPFVLGSGDYLGAFVITELGVVPRRALATGPVSVATLTLVLREYTGPVNRPAPKLGLVDLAKGGMPRPEAVSALTSVKSPAGVALGHAQQAVQLVRAGYQVYTAVRRGDAAAVLGRAPELFGAASRAVAPLEGFSAAAEALSGAGDLVALGGAAMSQVQTARTNLRNLDVGNVISRVESSGRALERTAALFDGAAGRLAGLAAKVATRRA
ncbi:phage tail protein [Alcaligenaceae bacterium]|nr:phage tail protein [Alcaligenaceae bacterium]